MRRSRPDTPHDGDNELRNLRSQSAPLLWFVGLLSLFSNLLMLTGPLYMLQVYDRVLNSGSEATLVSLTLLAAFLFAMMGVLDWARGRIMARIGVRFQLGLGLRISDLLLGERAQQGADLTVLRDMDAVQRVMVSPVMLALFDLPWVPIFLFGIWMFHPSLGLLAVAGGLSLVMISILHQRLSRGPGAQAMTSQQRADACAAEIADAADTVRSLGMRDAAFRRWRESADVALAGQQRLADLGGGFAALTRTLRLFLQSAMLGMGAWLVLGGELGPGAMIAGSILLGRALMPVEQVIGQWSALDQARRGWRTLARALSEMPPPVLRTGLPWPVARVQVQQMTVVPPGAAGAVLRGVSMTVEPGEAVGVIGPSGAGKSTLAHALTGVWPPVWGKVRLGGAALDHYAPDTLGRLVGYLPQQVQFFAGTIAENIGRLDRPVRDDAVIAAARRAGAHDMILDLPEGYDTWLDSAGAPLSGGQARRIGLARALYGDPVLLVLDEPHAGLDHRGRATVSDVIAKMKAAGGAVIVMAHHAVSVEDCDLLLLLDGGLARSFGPREQVLERAADLCMGESAERGLAS